MNKDPQFSAITDQSLVDTQPKRVVHEKLQTDINME